MENPIRVLIVECRKPDASLAQQLLNNYDVDFTLKSVGCKIELRRIEQHFNPNLVYWADDLPPNAQLDVLDLLYLLSLQSAVICVAQPEDKFARSIAAARKLRRAPLRPANALEVVQHGDSMRHLPESLRDIGDYAVAMSDSAGWITYANRAASRLLRSSSEHSIGTLLGQDHDFASPLPGAQRLAIFDAKTSRPNPVHLSDLVQRTIASARKVGVALPIIALAFPASGSTKQSGDCAISDDAIDRIASEFVAEAGGRGLIARIGEDAVMVVMPDPSAVVDGACREEPIMPPAVLLKELRQPRPSSIAHIAPKLPAELPDPDTIRRASLETGLEEAIRRHAISVQYQPQFELADGRGCGVEALARWQIASGDSIAPNIFIAIAERAGMIHSLGASVLKDACMTAAAWRGREEQRLTIAVNLSTLQINHEFTRTLGQIIDTSGLQASRLELEIAESAVVANADLTARCLKEWKQLGVRVAVNHAGDNYSSLSYLSRLPINRLKLDKSLVQGLTSANKTARVVHALISLGAELGVEVMAQGVETSSQFQMLRDLGCRQVQGYLFARPSPAVQAQLALRRSWGGLSRSIHHQDNAVAKYAS